MKTQASTYAFAAVVLAIVVVLVVPLPPALLDLLITVNITGALAILVTSMYVGRSLDFASFPSLLLLTTMFRLAISETDRQAEMAHVLDENGRGAHRRALIAFLGQMNRKDLLGEADPETVASQFLALLFGDTLLRVVLRAIEPPSPRECRRRAQAATAAVLQLHRPVSRT